jgi:hypothetical protein
MNRIATFNINTRNVSCLSLAWNRVFPAVGSARAARQIAAAVSGQASARIFLDNGMIGVETANGVSHISLSASLAKKLSKSGLEQIFFSNETIDAEDMSRMLKQVRSQRLKTLIEAHGAAGHAVDIIDNERQTIFSLITRQELKEQLIPKKMKYISREDLAFTALITATKGGLISMVASLSSWLAYEFLESVYFKSGRSADEHQEIVRTIMFVTIGASLVASAIKYSELGILNNMRMRRERKEAILEFDENARFLSEVLEVKAGAYYSKRLTTILNKVDPDTRSRMAAFREQKARSEETSEYVLAMLVNRDPDKSVRKAVAENPYIVRMVKEAEQTSLPGKIKELAGKPFPCVRAAIAGNPKASQEILDKLGQDTRYLVRHQAALNPRTSWQIVAQIMAGIRPDYREGVVGHERRWEVTRACHDYTEYEEVECPVFGVVTDYFSDSIMTANQILQKHQAETSLILEKLRELNPSLHEAIMKQSATPAPTF